MGAKDIGDVTTGADLGWFTEFACARRSIRRYLPQALSRELIDSLLQAAVTAPSAHNRQPWRFLVIETLATKHSLARAMGERLRADRGRDGDALDAIDVDVARSHARLTGAPVLVLICMSMVDMDRYADAKRNKAERLMALQGTAMAAQNLLLAAHAAGLGACWMCAPLFCPEVVSAVLDLPADWEPQAIVTLGFAADAGKPFRRRALSEVVRYAADGDGHASLPKGAA
jgi:coenzyme F420-0:L-glutamate ligase / coenzyme F420-1:gamma-L-glutamate ligase